MFKIKIQLYEITNSSIFDSYFYFTIYSIYEEGSKSIGSKIHFKSVKRYRKYISFISFYFLYKKITFHF